MKINQFNVPDFSNFNNDVSNIKNSDTMPVSDSLATRSAGVTNNASTTTNSPLMAQMREIARSTNLSDPNGLGSAVDQIARKIVGNLVSPEMAKKIDMDKMLAAISTFAQNDPTMSQKIQRMLLRME
jgi:hypothetical protein